MAKTMSLAWWLCALVGVAAAQPPPASDEFPKVWYEPTEPLRIVGPIQYVGTADLGAYLITTPVGHILIDGAMRESAAQLEASADDYRQTFAVLESLHPDVFLAAHASFFDLAGKRGRAAAQGSAAFVDPDGYRRRIADQKAAFEELVAKEEQSAGDSLGGTTWQLVRFPGSDGRVLIPDDRKRYTIQFGTDNSLSARIDCNHGRGTWQSAGPGELQLGPLALTRAMCPPGSLHDQIVKDWELVRSYVVKNGRLQISLAADGGTYEFEPASGTSH